VAAELGTFRQRAEKSPPKIPYGQNHSATMETTRKLLPRGVAGHYKKYLFSADLYSIDFAEI
jgi:hypothetical protein